MPQNEHLSPEWQQELGSDWQEIHARYLHTIGNLTLTGYNSELSDRPFAEKRDMKGGFKYSPIRLNRGLGQLKQWNREAIEKRAEVLANKAAQIWSIPHLPLEMTNKIGKLGQKVPLETVIGPIEHPLAGFVPANFKIMQMSKGKYHLLREVEGEWVYYGNGKVAWYAVSWTNAGFWARDKEKRNEMPLGVGGLITYATTITAATDQEMLTDEVGEIVANGTNGKKSYTLDDYPDLKGSMRELFEQLRRRISNLDVTVREEYKKEYILYRAATNFAAIAPKKELHVYLDMKIADIDDPKGLCKTFGNGNIDIVITSTDQLDNAMNLIRQSFERHWEESEMEVV